MGGTGRGNVQDQRRLKEHDNWENLRSYFLAIVTLGSNNRKAGRKEGREGVKEGGGRKERKERNMTTKCNVWPWVGC